MCFHPVQPFLATADNFSVFSVATMLWKHCALNLWRINRNDVYSALASMLAYNSWVSFLFELFRYKAVEYCFNDKDINYVGNDSAIPVDASELCSMLGRRSIRDISLNLWSYWVFIMGYDGSKLQDLIRHISLDLWSYRVFYDRLWSIQAIGLAPLVMNSMAHSNKLHSICCQNPILRILCWRKIYYDGGESRIEVVIARQRHDKHVSAASGADATIGMQCFLCGRLWQRHCTHVSTAATQHATIQEQLERVFSLCPCRGYILRTSNQPWTERAASHR
jgi:hypothetical protein